MCSLKDSSLVSFFVSHCKNQSNGSLNQDRLFQQQPLWTGCWRYSGVFVSVCGWEPRGSLSLSHSLSQNFLLFFFLSLLTFSSVILSFPVFLSWPLNLPPPPPFLSTPSVLCAVTQCFWASIFRMTDRLKSELRLVPQHEFKNNIVRFTKQLNTWHPVLDWRVKGVLQQSGLTLTYSRTISTWWIPEK